MEKRALHFLSAAYGSVSGKYPEFSGQALTPQNEFLSGKYLTPQNEFLSGKYLIPQNEFLSCKTDGMTDKII